MVKSGSIIVEPRENGDFKIKWEAGAPGYPVTCRN